MRLSRQKAISFLIEEESTIRHGYDVDEVSRMDENMLGLLLNKVFEPIDVDDPYIVDFERPCFAS